MKSTNFVTYWQHRLEFIVLGIAATIASLILIGLAIRFVLQLLAWRKLVNSRLATLELTPPAFTPRTSYANEKLFDVLAGQRSSRPWRDKLMQRDITMPFRITSTKDRGIRFLVDASDKDAPTIAQNIMSFLPEVKLQQVATKPDLPVNARILEFKQTGAWYFPLARHDMLDEHDPVSFLAGVMGKLEDNDIIDLQIIARPVKMRKADEIAAQVLRNEDILMQASARHSVGLSITHLIVKLGFGMLDMIGEIIHGTSSYDSSHAQRGYYDQLQIAKRVKPARVLSKFEQERNERVQDKVCSQLFCVTIRAMVAVDSEHQTTSRLAAIKSSLAAFDDASFQTLRPRLNPAFLNSYRRFCYEHNLPSLLKRHSCILSSAELASLYHFPTSETMKVDNLSTSLSRSLPAPVSLKQVTTNLDVVIGENIHHGTITRVGLTEAERERHIYVIGGTGNGKTTMLQYQIVQDMETGKGLAIIDPHGDMAETLLRHVPPERMKDVVYFNPDDLEYPIGLNPLELTPGLSGNELLREKDIITESVVSIFRKIFSEDDSGGHRIEYVLRNAIHTALTVDGATLFTVLKILQNSTYRKSITDKLEDEDLKDFWKSELGQAGNMQRVKMTAGITAKIGRFNANAAAKLILGQKKSTIDFEDIINSGKILVCNFSKGLLGEDVAELFGITVLAKLQLASLRRARLAQSERRAFYLYVDEFQNFATPSFVQMLSESRKYRLFMTLAEQSTSQQKDQQMIDVILANVGTVVCFRTGNPQDERLLLPLFSPYIQQGEIANLSSFNFYARLSAVKAQEPLSGHTLLLPDNSDHTVATEVIEHSRKHYTGEPNMQAVTTEAAKTAKPKITRKNTAPRMKTAVSVPGGR